MKITTFARYEWREGKLYLVDSQYFEYEGPLALCDRADAKATSKQGRTQSAQDQDNAVAANAATNAALQNYSGNLTKFMGFGRKTYGANGEFMRDQNSLATMAAAGGANNIRTALAQNAARTGENTASYAPTIATAQRQASQDLTNTLSQADLQRLQALTNINQYGVQASALPAQVQAGLYGTSVGGASGNLGPAASAAQVPSGWDVFGPAIIGAAGTVGGGFAGKKG